MEATSVGSVQRERSVPQQALRAHAQPTPSTVLEAPRAVLLAQLASNAPMLTRTLCLVHLVRSQAMELVLAARARKDPTAPLPSPRMVLLNNVLLVSTLPQERPDACHARQARRAQALVPILITGRPALA